MTKEEYNRLQEILDRKMGEGNRRFPGSPNRADGWKEAILSIKSVLHDQFKPKEEVMAYKPTCPRGYTDCIYDPAYIKFVHPEWYEELYGDMTVEEAAGDCREKVARDPDEKYYCYDDEDK